jgi:hypothetical protein
MPTEVKARPTQLESRETKVQSLRERENPPPSPPKIPLLLHERASSAACFQQHNIPTLPNNPPGSPRLKVTSPSSCSSSLSIHHHLRSVLFYLHPTSSFRADSYPPPPTFFFFPTSLFSLVWRYWTPGSCLQSSSPLVYVLDHAALTVVPALEVEVFTVVQKSWNIDHSPHRIFLHCSSFLANCGRRIRTSITTFYDF